MTRRGLFSATLRERRSDGPLYHVLTFETEAPIDASPGQFAMIRFDSWGSAPLLPRPMSLLTGGHAPSILIKVIGEGTRRMAMAAPGEKLTLLAPLGTRWSATPAGTTPILVAGGVGVAPLLCFARELAAAGVRPIALYGGRTAHDLPLRDALAEVAAVRVATEDGSAGTKGRVTVLLDEVLSDLGASKQGAARKVYTCGPERMMAAVAAMCAARNITCEVSLETPMGCGYGVCLGCNVPRASGGFLYACTEGPCIDASAIAWRGDR